MLCCRRRRQSKPYFDGAQLSEAEGKVHFSKWSKDKVSHFDGARFHLEGLHFFGLTQRSGVKKTQGPTLKLKNTSPLRKVQNALRLNAELFVAVGRCFF